MEILKGVGCNSCVKMVEEGYIHALLCLKSDGLVRKMGFKSTIDVE